MALIDIRSAVPPLSAWANGFSPWRSEDWTLMARSSVCQSRALSSANTLNEFSDTSLTKVARYATNFDSYQLLFRISSTAVI